MVGDANHVTSYDSCAILLFYYVFVVYAFKQNQNEPGYEHIPHLRIKNNNGIYVCTIQDIPVLVRTLKKRNKRKNKKSNDDDDNKKQVQGQGRE